MATRRTKLVAHSGLCSDCGWWCADEDYVAAFGGSGARSVIIVAIADDIGGDKRGAVAAEIAARGFIEGFLNQVESRALKQVAICLYYFQRWPMN